MKSEEPEGTTPIDPGEADGLIPTHIATRAELNEWEQANIVRGEFWAFSRRRSGVLSVSFLKELHRRMFNDTWRWAGDFRTSEKNIGITCWQIHEALTNLCEDVKHWLGNDVFGPDEAAVRFHHRMTHIHPFPNGNGRHARLMTDVFLVNRGRPRFMWGRRDLQRAGDDRDQYIAALRAADGQDYDALAEFLLLPSRVDGDINDR